MPKRPKQVDKPKPITMNNLSFLDGIVLKEDEMLELQGGTGDNITCGSNCGMNCGTNCGNLCGNSCTGGTGGSGSKDGKDTTTDVTGGSSITPDTGGPTITITIPSKPNNTNK